MREIKFRAWDDDEKEMIEYFSNDNNYQLLQTEEGNIFCGGYMRNEDWQEPVLMQFTGLKDKNGKEIYEGDIFKFDDSCLYTVIWKEKECLFYGKGDKGDKYGEFTYYFTCLNTPYHKNIFDNQCLIIGNIHENPELLKQPQQLI